MNDPKTIGDYTLIRELGRGGSSEVWLARRSDIEKPFVVKVLLPKNAQEAGYRRRFLREAKTVAGLSHSRIVSVVDYGESDSRLFLVMEFIDAVDLESLCRSMHGKGERFPSDVIAYIVAELLEALRYAHDHVVRGAKRCVIHRDIKPANILISSQGEVFVTDFGIALEFAKGTSEILGTVPFMAPEQAKGALAVPCTDIYAVGGVLHYLITGRAPRQVTNMAELVSKLEAGPPDLGKYAKDVPPALEQLRVAALEPDAFKRIRSAEDCQRMLEGCGGSRDRSRRLLRERYQLFIGRPRSGMSELIPAARTKPRQPTEIVPPPWSWWEDDELDEVPDEYRPTPDGDIEADAPRIRRRPRVLPEQSRHGEDPGTPAGPRVTETLRIGPPVPSVESPEDDRS